jgi:outer membrane protein TolC
MPPVMVGVQAKINIFNGFKKFHKIKSTHYIKNQVEEARNNAISQINLWVSQSYLKAMNAQDRYLKMKPVLALTSRNLVISEKRFQEGLSKSIDVIDSRLLDEKEQTESLQALYDYDIALSEVYFATGQPEKAVQILNR